MKITPKFLYDKLGKKSDVLLSYTDFRKLIERIEDLEDLISLREVVEEERGETSMTEEEFMEACNFTEEEIKSIEEDSEEEIFRKYRFTEEEIEELGGNEKNTAPKPIVETVS